MDKQESSLEKLVCNSALWILYITDSGIRVSRPAAKTGSRPAVPHSDDISEEIFDILDTRHISNIKYKLKV